MAGSTKRQAALKLGGLVVLIVAGSLLARHYGLLELIQQQEQLQATLDRFGIWAPIVYSGLRLVLAMLVLPLAPLTMATGFLFDPLQAVFINLWTTLASAMGAFYISRGAGRETVQALLKGRMDKLDQNIADDGIWVTIVLRLAPIFTFNAISYWAGLTRISARDFAWGTFLGMLPHVAIYTYLGTALAELSVTKMSLAVGGLLLLSILSALFRRRQWRARAGS